MKKTTLWIVSALALIIIAFVALYLPMRGSIGNGSDPIELYYADHISAGHQEVIDRFNTKFEGKIRVVSVDLPFSKFSTNELKEMLARSLRSKSQRLDIFSVDIIWVPRFAKWAYKLDQHFSDEILNNLNTHALESCYYQDQLVTIPIYIDVGILYYRKDLLKRFKDHQAIEQKLQKSISWNDFIALGKRWTETGAPYFIFPADNYEGFICLLHETLSSQRSHKIFGKDSIRLDDPHLRRSLNLLHDMIYTWKFSPPVVTEFNERQALNYALEKDALFVRGWPGYKTQYKNSVSDTSKLYALGEAPLPHFGDTEKTSVFGGWNLMISKYSTNKGAALEFIHFIQEEVNQITLYKKSGYIPILNSLFSDPKFTEQNPEIVYYKYLLNKGRHRPFREDYTQISDILSYYFKLVLQNQISIDEAIITSSEKINSDQAFIF